MEGGRRLPHRTPRVGILALGITALVVMLTGHGREVASTSSAYKRAQELLTRNAIWSFTEEMPHPWFRSTESLLRPLAEKAQRLPGIDGQCQVSKVKRQLALSGGNAVLLGSGDTKGMLPKHRKWRAWLSEVCQVLGFSIEEESHLDKHPEQRDSEDSTQPLKRELLCPELWVDEAWPLSLQERSGQQQMPIWSVTAGQGCGLMVIQAKRLEEFPPREVKALMGYELGRTIFIQMPVVLPPSVVKHAEQAYLAIRFFTTWQQMDTPWNPGRFLPVWRVPRPSVFSLPAGGLEFASGFLRHRRRSMLEMVAPWLLVSLETGILEALGRAKGMRDRALVVSLDRTAALAAGDARAAASALLRARSLLLADAVQSPEELERALHAAAAVAAQQTWMWRREALLLNLEEPRAEVRVLELLRWSDTKVGQRLLALAQMRRIQKRRQTWLQAWRFRTSGSEDFGPAWLRRCAWLGYVLLGGLFALPFLTSVDAVRWATLCTLVLTITGIALPFVGSLGMGAVQLPPLFGLGVAALLTMYAFFVAAIWWNHLLGGWRRWAKLSADLSAQLVDQSDVTAGIAYLAREWAELARRSLAALDQELCGSWRTSLHELASKLTDLKHDAEPDASVMVTQKAITNHAQDVVLRNHMMPVPQTLWQKVDHVVLRAAQVEASRMRCALDASPEELQHMQTWWRASGGSLPSSELSYGRGVQLPQESLESLLHSQKLHCQFPYPFFHGGGISSPESEAPTSSQDFRRLEQALQHNLQCLQDLRGRLSPLETARTVLFWTWADIHVIWMRFRHVLRFPKKLAVMNTAETAGLGASANEDPKDQLIEFRMMSCLSLATVFSFLGSLVAATCERWGWGIGTLSFGMANAVLLLNYSRLFLPHVRRRFERQLVELSRHQDALLQEVHIVQQNSQRARVVHNRAAIFLQSVNVIRNINYLALCIKTEVQRAGASGVAASRQQRQRIAECGMQILLALLPYSDLQWRHEALATEDCQRVAMLLEGQFPRRQLSGGMFAGHRQNLGDRTFVQSLDESQKRLWILFRMVHLSSVLPSAVHGQLGAVVERYLGPVIIEQRVPLDRQPIMEADEDNHRKSLLDGSTGGQSTASEPKAILALMDAGGGSLDDARSSMMIMSQQPAAFANYHVADAARTLDDDASSFCGSSASASVHSGSNGTATDTSKVLRKLSATSSDIARVLGRLPTSALIGPVGGHASSILSDIFSSIIILLPSSCLNGPGNFDNALQGRLSGGDTVVAAATGFHYGQRRYHWQGLETSIEADVAFSISNRLDYVDASPTELSVPLLVMLDDEPSQLASTTAWKSLSAMAPRRFGESALKLRRRALRRAKDSLRAMAGRS